MDEDIQKILKAIDRVKEKRQGQYLNNIADICWFMHSGLWLAENNDKRHIMGSDKPTRNLHCNVRKNVSYWRSDCMKVYIESDIESVETQTEPDQTSQHEIFHDPNVRLQNDHEEFKRFIHGEILTIKALTLAALPKKYLKWKHEWKSPTWGLDTIPPRKNNLAGKTAKW